MKLFLNLCLLAGLLSCASLPPKEEMVNKTKGMTLPFDVVKGKALVYVVRPSMVGTLVRFNVFVDGQNPENEFGWTRGKEYIHFYLKPGKHQIHSKAENWSSIEVDLKPNSITYIKQNAEMGIIMAQNNIHVIPDYEGKYHLISTTPGNYLKRH